VYFWFLLRQDPEIKIPSLIVRDLERRRGRLTREDQQRFINSILITSLKLSRITSVKCIFPVFIVY